MLDNLDIAKQVRDLVKEVAASLNAKPEAGSISDVGFWDRLKISVEKSAKSSVNFEKILKKTSTTLKFDFNKAAIVAKSSLEGLGQGFRNLHAIIKSSTSVFGGLIGAAWSIGKAIAAIPFRMLDGLEKMAEKGPQTQELAEAYERVRAEFGDLARGASKDIIEVSNAMGKLDGTGVSVLRVWGNLEKLVEAVQKLVSGMGASFNTFRDDVVANGEAMLRFNKALAITDDQMASISSQSLRMGKSVSGIQLEMAKQALGMSKAFGINAKVIGKDMARAMSDLAHFGHLSSKEMAVTATFAQKLGVSVDKLTSIMDATSTFDQTAESMGKLNEQFGTNVDFAEIMMAQDPAQKVEILRKEFQRTGLSLDKMNYQQRMLLKQTTSFDDTMLNAAFSTKNMGVTLAEVSKQGTKNEKTAMTQTEALTHLADSIERLTDPGPQASGGIFERMLQGMNAAIQSSPEFLGLMRSIVQVFKASYMTGMQLGRMFVGMWPGVKDVLGGFTDFFTMADKDGNAKGWGKLFKGIIDSFTKFKDSATMSVADLMRDLRTKFLDFFDDSKSPAKKVIEGVRKFLQVVSGIFSQFAILAIEEFSSFVPKLLDWLKNPHLPNLGMFESSWSNILDPLKAVLEKAQDVLWPAIKQLASGLFTMLKDALAKDNLGVKLLAGGIAIALAPALTQGLATVLSTGLFTQVTKQSKMGELASVFFGEFFKKEKTASPGSAVASAAASNADSKPSAAAKTIAAVAGMDPASVESLKTSADANISWDKVAKNAAGLAATAAILTGTFWAVMKIVQGQDPSTIMAAAAVMASFGVVMSQVPALSKALKNAEGANWKELGLVLAGLAGFMLVGMTSFAAAIWVVKDIALGDIIKAGIAMAAMTGVMTAAAAVSAAAMAVGAIMTLTEGTAALAMAAGLAGMGVVVVGAAGLAYVVTKALGNLSASAMTKSITAVGAVTGLMAAAGGLLIEASAVGAIMLTGIGAAAMLAGILAMGKVVDTMGDVAITLVKKLGSTSSERFATTAGIMSGMTTLYAALPSLIKSGALAGIVSFAFPGFLLEKIVISMADVAKKIIKTLGNVPIAAAATTAGIMLGMTQLFEKLPSLIMASSVVGAIMLTGVGAAAIAAGLTAVSSAVNVISDVGISLIKKFGSVPVSQIGSVSAAMLSVSGLFAITGGIILEAAAIGVGLSLGGALPAILGWKAMEQAVARMVDVATTIITNLSHISMSTDIQNKADAFKTIVTAIADLFSATSKILGNMPGSIFDTFMSVEKKIAAAKDFMTSVIGQNGGGIIGLITVIQNAVTTLPESKIETAKNIAQILSAVSSLMGNMVGPAMELQKRTSAWYRSGDTEAALFTESITKVKNFMTSIKDNITDLINVIVESVGNISAKANPEQLSSAASFLSTTFSAVGTLMTSLKAPDAKVDAGFLNFGQQIKVEIPTVTSVLSSLKTELPSLFTSLTAIINAVPTGEDFVKKIETSAKIFGLINPVLKAVNALSEASKDNIGAAGDKDAVLKVLADLHGFLWSLRDPSKLGLVAALTEMKGLTDAVLSVASLDELKQSTSVIEAVSGTLKTFSNSLGSISSSFDNLNGNMEMISESAVDLKTDIITRALSTVSDIAKRTQELEDALSDIKLDKIPVKLEKIAKDGGLMGPYTYSVKSKDVIVNLHIDVYMKASEVEKALVHRSDSIIRDRINYALGGIEGDNVQKSESIRSYPVESGLYAPDVN